MKYRFEVGVVIAFIIGVAIAWVVKPAPAPPEALYYKGKYAEPPSPGTVIKLVQGLDAAYPPWTEINPEGVAVGFDVDMVEWIEDHLNATTDYTWDITQKPLPWEGIYYALKEGECDLIASGATIIAEKAEIDHYGLPYFTYHMNAIVKVDTELSWEEILESGKKISCQIGTDSEMEVDHFIEEGHNIEKLALESYPLALTAVKEGRAIAAISDSSVTVPLFKKPEFYGLKELTSIGGPKAFSIVFRYGDKWLYDTFNKAVYEFMKSPEYREYLLKWEII